MDKIQHACIWTTRSHQAASAATSKETINETMVENAFLTDQCTKFIFALFYVIVSFLFCFFKSRLKPLVSSQRCCDMQSHHIKMEYTNVLEKASV